MQRNYIVCSNRLTLVVGGRLLAAFWLFFLCKRMIISHGRTKACLFGMIVIAFHCPSDFVAVQRGPKVTVKAQRLAAACLVVVAVGSGRSRWFLVHGSTEGNHKNQKEDCQRVDGLHCHCNYGVSVTGVRSKVLMIVLLLLSSDL